MPHLTLASLSALLVPLVSMMGSAAVVLSAIAHYRERREEDMHEATTIWQSLAEAREAETVALKAKLALRDVEIQGYHDRCAYLWTELLRRTDLGTLTADPGIEQR